MKPDPKRWAVKWNEFDDSWIMWRNCLPLLFRTRKEARAWIAKNYGYIRTRKDLRTAPHHWRLPTAVLVTVTLKEPRDDR